MSVPGADRPTHALGDADAGVSGDSPIQVRALTRTFGEFIAVDRVTFAVRPGEIFGFLGPNGAGKTTTIKMLTGLLSPTSGDAQVAGYDVWTERFQIKRHLGYMSQKFSLYPDLTVDENIELFAGLYGVAGADYDARRDWVLEMAGLQDREGLLTGELPLGWKQRLALGCALLHEPPILFLDEPTSGVDPLTRRRFWDTIDGLSAAGTTILVSTHYMEEAEYCHRLILMNRGSVVATDTPSGLRASMTEPIFRVGGVDAPKLVEGLSQAPGIVDAALFGRDLHVVVSGEETGRTTIENALPEGARAAAQIEAIEPSLEDVFVSLIRREGGAPL